MTVCQCNEFDANVSVQVTGTATTEPLLLMVGNANPSNDRRAQLALNSSNPLGLGSSGGQAAVRFGTYYGDPNNLRLQFVNHSGVEVACVTNGGRLGIGTGLPFDKVSNTTGNILDGAAGALGGHAGTSGGSGITWDASASGYLLGVQNQGAVGNAHGALIRTTRTDATIRILTLTSGPVGGGTVRLIARADGNVGIGNPAPEARLDITGPGSAAIVQMRSDQLPVRPRLYVRAQFPSATPTMELVVDGDGGVQPNLAFTVGSGNVGIGTTQPTAKLDVRGFVALGATGQQIQPDQGAAGRTLRFSNSTSESTGGFEFINGNVGASLVMIRQDGNVGIGTGAPESALDVRGSVKVRDNVTIGQDLWAQSAIRAGLDGQGNGRKVADGNGCYYA